VSLQIGPIAARTSLGVEEAHKLWGELHLAHLETSASESGMPMRGLPGKGKS